MTLFVDNAVELSVDVSNQDGSAITDAIVSFSLGEMAVSGTVENCTNASPIVVTSAFHQLEVGDEVTITQVEGNRAANGTHVVSAITTNSFTLLGSIGDGDFLPGKGRWYRAVPGIGFLPAVQSSQIPGRYSVVVQASSPIIAGQRYILIVHSENCSFHAERELVAQVRRG